MVHTTYRPRYVARPLVCATLLASAGLLAGMPLPSPAQASTKGSSGSFTFTGEIAGTLKVVGELPGDLTGCAISPSQGGTDVIVWDNVKLKQEGKIKKASIVDLQLQVSKFGHTYSMKTSSDGTALGAVYLSATAPYQWASKSGTITTTDGGKSGTVTGVLSAGKAHSGTVTIKGTWAGCAKEE
jgi:hypothetical protein